MIKILLKIGDRIVHKTYGEGAVKDIDKNDVNFRYLIVFDDGSKSWLANWQVQKEVTILGQKEDRI